MPFYMSCHFQQANVVVLAFKLLKHRAAVGFSQARLEPQVCGLTKPKKVSGHRHSSRIDGSFACAKAGPNICTCIGIGYV